jgi:hypothetical protein
MDNLSEQIERLRRKIAKNSVRLNPCCPLGRIEAFESEHGIVLPGAYRRFINEIGDGGQGPPHYGVSALGKFSLGEASEDDDYWNRLPHIRYDFPFTKIWIWEDGDTSPEGDIHQIDFGSIRLGTHGCSQYFHLIVTGPERGMIWNVADVGICREVPGGDFVGWYEAWLDQ